MQPVEYFTNDLFDIRGHEAQRDAMEYNDSLDASLAFEHVRIEERKRKRTKIHNQLVARDGKRDDSMEHDGHDEGPPPKTYRIEDLMLPITKRTIQIYDIMKIPIPRPVIHEPFQFQLPDPFDDPETPSILDNIPHVIPECLGVRQSYTTKYLKGVQRCLKEGVYDYRTQPDFDPIFPDPDPEIPSLAEACAREKEERVRMFRREQADKDRERMPPPAIPQTPSTSDDSNPSFPNGQSNVNNNNGVVMKEETVVEKKFGCKVEGCPKSYKNLQGLKNHVKKEHPGVMLPSKLSHSEESILATALGGNAPPKLPPPPVHQRLPQPPPMQQQQQQRPRTPQQQMSSSIPITTPQQPQTPSAQHRYEVQQQQQPPMTPTNNQQHQSLQNQQYIQSPHHQQIQSHQIQQQPQQQQVQYAQVAIPVSQAYPSQHQQIQGQGLPPQQQQARLPPLPSQHQTSQVYHHQAVMESPQSVQSEYTSTVASPMSVMSQDSMDDSITQGALVPATARKPSAKSVTISTKTKCPHCTKTYKTQQNLTKHIRENHPAMVSEVEVTYTKGPQPTTTYYVPPSNVNRQEVMYVEQAMGDPNNMQQDGRSVTIVRQPQPQVHIIDDQQQQLQTAQIVTSQSGQTILHYVQQVRQQPHQQQQSQPMEVDSPQQQQHQIQQSYGNTQPGQSPDVIMISDATPPATPRNVLTPIVSSDQQQQQTQQVYIQTSNGQLRAAPGQQIIRQQGRSVLYQSQPVFIQQQPFSGEKYTVVVRPQGAQYRTVNPQQVSRNGQQIISNQQGGTFAYPVNQPNSNSRYFTTAPPQRAIAPANSGQASSSQSQTVGGNPAIEGTISEGNSNDYYSAPPQLTPQQSLPQRARPQQGYQVYNRGTRIPQSQVRIATVTNPGQKGSTVKYAIPQGGSGQAFIASQGSIQYIRTSSGNIAPNNQVKFITAPVRVSSNPQRPGQSNVQQYPVAVSGQPVSFTGRAPPYTVRGQSRVRIAVPNSQGAPRRPLKPMTQIVHQQPLQQQQQQQAIQSNGPQEVQRIMPVVSSSSQQLQPNQPPPPPPQDGGQQTQTPLPNSE